MGLMFFYFFNESALYLCNSLVHFTKVNLMPLSLFFSGMILFFLMMPFVSQSIFSTKSQYAVIAYFIVLVYFFTSTQSALVLFMCYELFVLPSFLLVFYASPNSSSIVASMYFLMWTQVGSFFVLLGIIFLFVNHNIVGFFSTIVLENLPAIFIFFGFGIKVPVWPFHFWLSKTHVEAPTYFSVYLSGFLVKTALYGLYFFCDLLQTSSMFPLFLSIATFSVMDSSVKMWGQVDLKKLVAFGTIQEMNLMLICMLVNTNDSIKCGILFMIAHTLLSSLFFLLVDSLYRSFNTRSTTAQLGIFQKNTTLGFVLFVSCLLFCGLPFTLKFSVEVYTFSLLMSTSPFICLLVVFFANWVGLVSFCRAWFITLFGVPSSEALVDISYSELLVYIYIFIFLVLVGTLSANMM